jgi:5-methylcytosine-specific restriction endonuclease McrA
VRRLVLPYLDDPTDTTSEAHWEMRLRAQEERESLSVEVYEQDRRHEPKHIGAKVGGANRRARRTGAVGSLSPRLWRAVVRAYSSRCAYCDDPVPFPILEHVVPLRQGGATDICNVVPACRTCNAAKRGRDPLDWLGPAGAASFIRRVLKAGERFPWPST